MAFTFASIEPAGYHNESVAGVPTAIAIIGRIKDDSWQSDYVGAFRIEGDVFAALPAADPATDGTPADPRFQAVMGLVAQFVKSKHAELTAIYSATPVIASKPAEQLAALPTLTPELLAQLAPDTQSQEGSQN